MFGVVMVNKVLSGGQNDVVVTADTVLRQYHPWSGAIRKLLQNCEEKGLDIVPKWLGTNLDGQDVFQYMEGEVAHYPLPCFFRTDRAV